MQNGKMQNGKIDHAFTILSHYYQFFRNYSRISLQAIKIYAGFQLTKINVQGVIS